jgi:hypothetical protein
MALGVSASAVGATVMQWECMGCVSRGVAHEEQHTPHLVGVKVGQPPAVWQPQRVAEPPAAEPAHVLEVRLGDKDTRGGARALREEKARPVSGERVVSTGWSGGGSIAACVTCERMRRGEPGRGAAYSVECSPGSSAAAKASMRPSAAERRRTQAVSRSGRE